MEDFIAHDVFENRPRRRIVVDDLAIECEAAGGGLFGDMEKGEEAIVGLIPDGQILEAVPAGQRIAGRSPRLRRASL